VEHTSPEDASELRTFRFVGIEVDQFSGGGIEADKVRSVREGGRREPGMEGFRQAGVAVVEGKFF